MEKRIEKAKNDPSSSPEYLKELRDVALRLSQLMEIALLLDPDQSDAFAASFRHFLGDVPGEGFLERCIDNLIEAEAKGGGPGGEGGSYNFEAPGAVVAAFTRETVLAVVDETALAKAE